MEEKWFTISKFIKRSIWISIWSFDGHSFLLALKNAFINISKRTRSQQIFPTEILRRLFQFLKFEPPQLQFPFLHSSLRVSPPPLPEFLQNFPAKYTQQKRSQRHHHRNSDDQFYPPITPARRRRNHRWRIGDVAHLILRRELERLSVWYNVYAKLGEKWVWIFKMEGVKRNDWREEWDLFFKLEGRHREPKQRPIKIFTSFSKFIVKILIRK